VTPPQIWIDPFVVRAYEAGAAGRLTVPRLCDWLQEAAGNHATALGVATDRLLASGRAWVLARLHVALARLPAWREEVVVETWPSAENGLVAERDFIMRSATGEELGRATSHWVVIDVARRRPGRLPRAVVELQLPGRPRALAGAPAAVHPPEESASEYRFTVLRNDLDLNEHTNNSRYVAWALEGVPEEIAAAHACIALDVHFRAESVYGDQVVARTGAAVEEPAGAVHLRHAVVREPGGAVLAVLRSRWRRNAGNEG
jgi:medium-chain acyl-[acyl-carrier-protein] hydrolase